MYGLARSDLGVDLGRTLTQRLLPHALKRNEIRRIRRVPHANATFFAAYDQLQRGRAS